MRSDQADISMLNGRGLAEENGGASLYGEQSGVPGDFIEQRRSRSRGFARLPVGEFRRFCHAKV